MRRYEPKPSHHHDQGPSKTFEVHQQFGRHPVRKLTVDIVKTFSRCNPKYTCKYGNLPRRVLTEPSQPSSNDGYDNEHYDYIFSMYDEIRNEKREDYIVEELLGRGTFGQVLLCRDSNGTRVAVKVVKNRKAFQNQAVVEVKILKELNKVEREAPGDSRVVRLLDAFLWRKHLCLVFELLQNTLYDLLKESQFEGLSLTWIRHYAVQIVQGLLTTHRCNIIHCDLKPENLMFVPDQKRPNSRLKIIDYGSSCYSNEKFYSYIQSRFYRAPEVILGTPYSNKIDIWSFGCILVELYLGLPIFPGNSMYDQLRKIINILGVPPERVVSTATQADKYLVQEGTKVRLKTQSEFEASEQTKLPPAKNYYKLKSLDELTNSKILSKEELEEHLSFIDFIKGCLELDPERRLSADQAYQHCFLQQQGSNFTQKCVYGERDQKS